MSILINGMDMPKQGEYQARLVVYKEGLSSLSVTVKNVTTTYDIVEIPTPHGRLIDADRLLESGKTVKLLGGDEILFVDVIRHEPTILEAEGKP